MSRVRRLDLAVQANPVVAYSVIVGLVVLGLLGREMVQRPTAMGLTAWLLFALLSGRTVSLAEDRRALLTRLPAEVAR